MEHPNEEGQFRYICFEGDDYSKISKKNIHLADFSFWNIPEEYVEEGFDKVDTVYVEDEHLFLIHGQNFVRKDRWGKIV